MEQIIESTNNGASQQNSVLQEETADDENTDDDNSTSDNASPIINNDNSDDLIDFQNGISPILSRTCSEQNLSIPIEAEHLLDSELTKLEEVLQKYQSKNLIKFDNDHELNILINLNNSFSDNTDNTTQIKKLHRSNSALLLDIFSDNNESSNHQVINRSKSANDLEFFNFDDELSSDNQRQQHVLSITNSIEECLYDLDQYLQEYDLNDQEINNLSHSNPFRNTLSTVNCRKYDEFRRKTFARNTFNGFTRKNKKLGNIVGSGTGSGSEGEDEDENIDWSWVYELEKKNNHQSIENNVSGDIPLTIDNNNSCIETDVNNITELPPEQSINNRSGSGSNNNIVPPTTTTSDDNQASEMSKSVENEIKQERSWLRSSMRRLRHFRLPDTEDIPSTNNTSTTQSRIISTPLTVTVATPSIIEQTASVLQQPMDNFRQHTHRRVRPTSAPNRLSFSQDFQINRQISVHPAGDTGVEGVVQNFNVNTNTNSVLLVNRSRSTNRGYRNSSNGRSSSSDLHHHHGARSSSESSRSRRPRSVSSTDSSIDEGSSIDTTSSCSPTGTPTRNTPDITASSQSRRVCDHTTGSTIPTNGTHTSRHHRVEENTNVSNSRATNTGRPPGGGSGGGGGGGATNRNSNNNNNNSNEDHLRSPIGQWKHRLSSMLASLGCTLGIFNISRFAILSIHFGANFIVQFMVLSLVFGIPLFTLHTCLGQQLNAGVIDMWRISPIFQGVGIALLVAQALIGMYSIIGVSWLFVFFRDSFITKMDNYKWAEPFDIYRYDQKNENGTYKITETVPDYFNGQVLQRYSLAGFDSDSFGNNVKFQVCFNLAVVWIIIFVSLSKGLKSYGKVVFLFTLVPLFCTFILCAKLLGLTPTNSRHGVFSQTSWPEFFLNTKCWVAAFQESFLTWGLFGAAAMQIASHNKHKHLLQRDTGLVVVITCTVLLLAAFLANTCVEVLQFYGYNYLPGSFETTKSYIFMRNVRQPLPPNLSTTPVRYMMHSSLILGERVIRPGIDRGSESGYQPLRFATELIPATFTIIGPDQLSPFWAVLFYFIMILFGISQQLAIWHCVITGIIAMKAKVLKSWQMSITFFSCLIAFLIGIIMTTEYGIYAVYFFDYCVGGTWWLSVLYIVFVSAVFMVRGRPYSGDSVVTALFTPGSHACLVQWAAPLLSFIWNVVLPVALVVYCISTFRNGNFRELYTWHHAPAYDYWALWARQLGSLLQLLPILTVPIAAFVQSYRYLNKGPPDILDRIQLLYRPPLDSEHMEDLSSYSHSRGAQTNTTNSATATDPAFEDPPPKYTPPPSYTTATGARIAKLLRQSIRRSVRRLANVLGESSESRDQHQQQANQQQSTNIQQQLEPPPPDYAAVLVEMNQSPHVAISITDTTELPPPPTVRNVYNSETNRSSTIDRRTHNHNSSSTLTAAEVASILRSSIRRSTIRAANTLRRSVVSEESTSGSLSVVCLVDGAEPIGQDSLTMDQIQKDNIKNENLSSVI